MKAEVGNILEHLCVGIYLEAALADRLLDAFHRGIIVTGLLGQTTRRFGVELVKAGAPLQVAVTRHRVIFARRFPALDMLGAHGQPDGIVGLGRVTRNHLVHALPIQQLTRHRLALSVNILAGILRIGGIDQGGSAIKQGTCHG